MKTFVVQTPHDRDVLLRECKQRQKLVINVTLWLIGVADLLVSHVCTSSKTAERRLCDIAHLKKWGITHWLDQTYSCPHPVRWVLLEVIRADTIV